MNKNHHLPKLNNSSFYTNPPEYKNLDDIPANPDPYVIKYNGIYYCYSTDEKGVNVSSSKDMVVWEFLGKAVCEKDKHDYWAPCVIYDNGIFYLYCSNTSIDTKDNHQEYLQLYTASAPEGPFIYVRTFFQKFSIDAHVVKDYNGTPYLFYSVNDYAGTDEDKPGTVILADRLIGFTELAGEETAVVLPSAKEEIFEEDRFGDGRDWYTVEGAFFHRRHRRAYLIYAANAYIRENYFLGYSIAEKDSPIPDIQWEKYPGDYIFSPLVRKTEQVEGTGHCCVIQAPNLTDDWLIYHGRDKRIPLLPQTEQRVMRIDPLLYSGDRLITNAPSHQAQDAPNQPAFTCYGEFDPLNFETTEENGISRKVLKQPFENYIMEWDISCCPTHMGARYGILLSYKNPGNFLELLFDSGKRLISIIQEENHIKRILGDARLPLGYNHEASHNVRILRNFEQFSIYLDGVLILHPHVDVPFGRVGFIARYTNASAAFFAINHHVELYGRDLCFFSKIFKSNGSLFLTENKTNGTPKNISFSSEEQLLHNTKPCICCLTKLPAELDEIHPTGNFMKAIECSLLSSSSFLKAEIREDSLLLLTVLIKGGILHFIEYENGTDKVTDQKPYSEKNFTLYMIQNGSNTAVYLDNHYYIIQSPKVRPQTLHLTAYQLSITGYEMSRRQET